MRGVFPAVVLVAALGLGFALRLAAPTADDPGISLLAVSAPTVVRAGESYSAYGGFSLPAGRYEKRFRFCGPNGCTGGGWGSVTGPAEWWGYLGGFTPAAPGAYQAEFLLFERDRFGAWRAVARHAWSVDAR